MRTRRTFLAWIQLQTYVGTGSSPWFVCNHCSGVSGGAIDVIGRDRCVDCGNPFDSNHVGERLYRCSEYAALTPVFATEWTPSSFVSCDTLPSERW